MAAASAEAAASAATSAAATAAAAALFRVASNLWMAEASAVGLLLLLPEGGKFHHSQTQRVGALSYVHMGTIENCDRHSRSYPQHSKN